jgi:HSP20 family molecular chaperone IbpA
MSTQECTRNGEAERSGDASTCSPLTDILETSTGYELRVDLPGADPDSLELTFEGEQLTIHAKARPKLLEAHRVAHAEFELCDYERAFAVRERIDAAAIEAELKHGVLTVRVPKAKPASHKIQITTERL